MTSTKNSPENEPFEEPMRALEGADAAEPRDLAGAEDGSGIDGGVDDGGAHAALHRRFRALVRLMGCDRAARRAEHGPAGDPSRGQGRVLAALRMQSPIATKDLAFLLGIRQQSLNEVLGRLQGAGLIERAPSQEDRRVMLVHLTGAGRAAGPAAPADCPFAVLDEEEAARLVELLDKVIAPLSQRLGEHGASDEEMESMRERLGEERFAHVMRMREHGLGLTGPRGCGGHGGHGGHDGHCHGGHGPHGGPRGAGHHHGVGHGRRRGDPMA